MPKGLLIFGNKAGTCKVCLDDRAGLCDASRQSKDLCQHRHSDDRRLLAGNTWHADGADDAGEVDLGETARGQPLAEARPLRAAADEADEGQVAVVALALEAGGDDIEVLGVMVS